ncbi:winged helix-turn-helix domain-containing protein [Rhizobium sp. FY34]|uniref:winged helix-turn-helix domain-containing protein n=1 Tax=Rhizobium sp. FY34 TaxID=2562309 RepID=UPI0010C08AF7|nr:winged helix-turn-helix domain-containing protein [Rhizobium sp. FY34]
MPTCEKDPIRIVLRIDFAPGSRLGRGKIELMEHIRDTGSISAAGRAMDMSYRRAWLLVDQLNHMFTEPAVDSQRGGKQGGGAQLTPFGQELLVRFRAMEKAAETAMAGELEWLRLQQSHSAPGQEKEPD